MPTYDYLCDACAHKFELFQSIKDKHVKKCPECGKRKLRRLFGIGAAVVFKGSGFYQTDYRSASYKKRAAEEVVPLQQLSEAEEVSLKVGTRKPAARYAVRSLATFRRGPDPRPDGSAGLSQLRGLGLPTTISTPWKI